MGLQDRDFYRDALASKRTPHEASTARVALIWVVVLVILFAVFRFVPPILSRSTPVPPATVASPAVRAGPPPPMTTAPSPRPLPPEPRASVPASAPIYRCGSQYSREPCVGARVVDEPAASGFDSRPSERLARLVADGRSSDSNVSTTVTRTETTGGAYGPTAAGDRSTLCASLAAELDAIDRNARRPLQASQQDWLRERRHRVRDQQAAMHC